VKRKTLDILFSIGGVGLAALLLVIGVVMSSNANFSKKYVTDQLTQEKITFKTADTLTDEERQAPCLVAYAGQALTTGKQAECYANEFIGLHVKTSGNNRTYAEIGDVQTDLRAQIAAGQKNNDPAVADLQKQLADVTTQRETVFKGETLRGILLTSYGFSVLGDKAAQASTAIYLGVLLLVGLSIAGFAHALITPKNETFAAPQPEDVPRIRRPVKV
jgi:ribosomal protein L29